MSQTSNNILKPAINFLQHYAPFNQMSMAHQEYLAMHLEQIFFSEGDIILSSAQGVSEYFYIIKNGQVNTQQNTFKQGECFPITEFIDKNPITFTYYAQKSTICYQLKYSHFEYLMQQCPIFHHFFITL